MPRNLAFLAALVAVLLVTLAAFACGDDDASDALDDTPTPEATESPTPSAAPTAFVPDPSDPCPRPAGQAISGLVALLEFGNEALDEGEPVPVGEVVQMTLRVINCSEQELERKFAGEQAYDFVVRTPGGDTVWRWSDDQEFSTVGSTFIFDPRQELSYETGWAQVDSEGQAVPSGEYDVIGESFACDVTLRNCAARAAATITISP